MPAFRPIRIILVNCFVFVLLLIGAELCFRLVFPGYMPFERTHPGQYANGNAPVWAYPDDDLGWTMERNTEKIPVLFPGIAYKSNEEGFRDSKAFTAEALCSDCTRIMVLGDSFAFGVGVNQEHCISSLLEKNLGQRFQVFNLSIPGYGIDQMYLAYKKYAPVIRPDIVIVVFISQDVTRTFEAFRKAEQMNKPAFMLGPKGLMLRGRNEQPDILERAARHSHIANAALCFVYRRIYTRMLVERMFEEMRNDIRARHARFIVVKVPLPGEWAPASLRERFIDLMTGFSGFFRGTPESEYVDLFDVFRKQPQPLENFLPRDTHLSEKGHALVADTLKGLVLK